MVKPWSIYTQKYFSFQITVLQLITFYILLSDVNNYFSVTLVECFSMSLFLEVSS